MSCEKYENLISKSLLHEITEDEKTDLENHKIKCPECSKKYRELLISNSYINKYYQFNNTKFNIFKTEQELKREKKKILYYVSGLVATFILITLILIPVFKEKTDNNIIKPEEGILASTETVSEYETDSYFEKRFETLENNFTYLTNYMQDEESSYNNGI